MATENDLFHEQLSSLRTYLSCHQAGFCYGNTKVNAMSEIHDAISELQQTVNQLADRMDVLHDQFAEMVDELRSDRHPLPVTDSLGGFSLDAERPCPHIYKKKSNLSSSI